MRSPAEANRIIENAYDVYAFLELQKVIGVDSPFHYVAALDKGEKRAWPRVFEVTYQPFSKSIPKHFRYLERSLQYQELPHKFEFTWIEEPQLNQRFVIKRHSNTPFGSIEKTVLQRTNDIFDTHDQARPLRLCGYSTGEHNSQMSYLVLEHVDKSFISMEEYLVLGRRYPLEEVLDIAIALSDVLAKTHKNGICHIDLEADGLEDHVFWDPLAKRMRVIDWETSNIKGTEFKTNKGSYAIGQVGIGQLLLRGLTGRYKPYTENYMQDLGAVLPEPIREYIQAIIELSIGLNERDDDKFQLSRTTKGTNQLHNDLVYLRAQLT